MQILKLFLYVCVQIKTIPENFIFLTLKILSSYFPVKFASSLKSTLIFNIFYCFWTFVNKRDISKVRMSQKVKSVLMWNFQHIIFIWKRRYWKIFKSALVYLEPFYLSALARLIMFFMVMFFVTSIKLAYTVCCRY